MKEKEEMVTLETHEKSLPWYTKVGFALGTVGDSIPYYLFYTYFLYYLTDVVGINPATAGILSSVAMVWNAVACPIVGYMSDNSKNPKGRRRPLIQKAFVGEGVFVVLLFTPTPFTGAAQIVYYLVIALLLWTSYTCMLVPWQSLGAEIAEGYNDRNTITMWVSILSLPCTALCNSGPMWIQALLLPKGFSQQSCWVIISICGAIILFIGVIVMLVATRGREHSEITEQLRASDEKHGFKEFFETVKCLLTLKQYRVILFVGLFFLTAYTLNQAVLVYIMTYNAGMTAVQMGTFWVVFSVVAVVGAPLCTAVANVTTKKTSFMLFSILNVVMEIVFFFLGIDSPVMAYVFGILFAITTAGFWTVFYSMIYDIVEVFEFKYGTRNEGSVISFASFIQTCGGAVATLIAGFSLELIGYTGEGAVTQSVSQGLLVLVTLVPAAVVLVSIIFLSRYKINRDNFNALKEAIDLRKENKEYSTEKFKEIL